MSIPLMRALVARDVGTAEREIGASIPEGFSDHLDHFLRYRLAQLDADPTILSWLARAMVLTDETGARRIIGTIGFHSAPDEQGRLEIGYRIEAEYRRRGYTREAVQAMFDWAASEHGVHRFVASIRPDMKRRWASRPPSASSRPVPRWTRSTASSSSWRPRGRPRRLKARAA